MNVTNIIVKSIREIPRETSNKSNFKTGKITTQFIEKLIEHGADINCLDEDDRSPLLLTCLLQIDPGNVFIE